MCWGTLRCGTGLSVSPSVRLSVHPQAHDGAVRLSHPGRTGSPTAAVRLSVRLSSRPTGSRTDLCLHRRRRQGAPRPSVRPSPAQPGARPGVSPSLPASLCPSVRPLSHRGGGRGDSFPSVPRPPGGGGAGVPLSSRPAARRPPRPPLTWCVLLPSTAVTPRSPPQPSPPSSCPPPVDARRAAANATAATATVSRAAPRGPMATPVAAAAPRPHRPRPASSPVRHAPLVNGAQRHAPSPRPRRVIGSRGRRSTPANRLHRGSIPISSLLRQSPPFSSRDWLSALVRWVRARPSHPAREFLST